MVIKKGIYKVEDKEFSYLDSEHPDNGQRYVDYIDVVVLEKGDVCLTFLSKLKGEAIKTTDGGLTYTSEVIYTGKEMKSATAYTGFKIEDNHNFMSMGMKRPEFSWFEPLSVAE